MTFRDKYALNEEETMNLYARIVLMDVSTKLLIVKVHALKILNNILF